MNQAYFHTSHTPTTQEEINLPDAEALLKTLIPCTYVPLHINLSHEKRYKQSYFLHLLAPTPEPVHTISLNPSRPLTAS